MRSLRSFKDDNHANADVKQVAAGGIIMIIALVIAFSFIPTLTSSAQEVADDANSSALTVTIVNLVPSIVVASFLFAGVSFMIRGLRGVGGS